MRLWSRTTALLLVLGALTLTALGYGSALAADERVFRIMCEEDYGGKKYDPGLGFSLYAADLYLGLGRVTPKNEYSPGAALRYDISADGRAFTFHLRHDARWSDGTPLTAGDFEYAWKRALDPNFGSARAYMLYLVSGAEAYNKGKGKAQDVGVKAVDDYTLQVKLVSSAPFFPLYASANNVYFPVPKHVVEKFGDNWTDPKNIVTSGPFKVKERVANSHMVLVPNELYPLEKAKIDKLVVYVVPQPAVGLAKYENDELDFTWNIPVGEINRVRSSAKLSKELGSFVEANQTGLEFNQKFPPLDNPLVRKAIAMAVDPDPIIAGPLQSMVERAFSLFVPGVAGGRDDVALPYDPDKARSLLKEAGYPGGKGLPEVTLVTRSSSNTSVAAAQAVQGLLENNLGVRIKIRAIESAAYYKELYAGDVPLALTGAFSLTPDPYDLFNVLQGNLHNYQNWNDPEWDAKLKAATSEPDPKKRLAIYYELEDKVVREATMFQPLYNGVRYSLQKPNVKHFLGWDRRNLWILSHEYVEIAQ